jgi:hypothetical protein
MILRMARPEARCALTTGTTTACEFDRVMDPKRLDLSDVNALSLCGKHREFVLAEREGRSVTPPEPKPANDAKPGTRKRAWVAKAST